MKISIIIPCFNRPAYIADCFDHLDRADIPEGTRIVLVDDASTDFNAKNLIASFKKEGCSILRVHRSENGGVKQAIKDGVEYAMDSDLIMVLDSDAIVRNDFIKKIVELKVLEPERIVTGFNCTTKNKDGSIRHFIQEEKGFYNIKKTVGGINMAFTPVQYKLWVLPALNNPGNWDQNACLNSGKGVACVVPSVVQHIGHSSSMGHTSGGEPADVADDFKPLHLPTVTLVCVDCVNPLTAVSAIQKSMRHISFGSIKFITNAILVGKTMATNPLPGIEWINITEIKSKEEYSSFMLKELSKYIETEFVLIIQADGYVINYKAWDSSFLDYSMVGACWEWYNDDMRCGNQGFGLRSKKLLDISANDNHISELHPEDHILGRVYRKYLEDTYQIKFAPDEVCRKFSIEAWRNPNPVYNGQFGFHGQNLILPQNI